MSLLPTQPHKDGEPLKLREQAYEGYTRSLLAQEIKPGQFITSASWWKSPGFHSAPFASWCHGLKPKG